MNNSEFFVSRAITFARSMPLPEGITFLRGMLEVSKGTPSEPPIRAAYNTLNECDEQLELIASGQLKLPLAPPARKGTRK